MDLNLDVYSRILEVDLRFRGGLGNFRGGFEFRVVLENFRGVFEI